jgi:hypothetical protein
MAANGIVLSGCVALKSEIPVTRESRAFVMRKRTGSVAR